MHIASCLKVGILITLVDMDFEGIMFLLVLTGICLKLVYPLGKPSLILKSS